MKSTFRLSLILFTAAVFIISGCKKSDSCNGVPNVAVNFTVDPTTVGYNPLLVTGGTMVVTGGYDNILLYRYTVSQLNAFDCCCPYDGASNAKAIVQIQANKITATCPVCGSSFLLADGSVNHGPATCGLKKYNTTYDGVSTFNVSN